MKISNINKMKNGFFVGDFNPTTFASSDVEIAVKSREKGEVIIPYYRKTDYQIVYIMIGEVMLNGKRFQPGDIIQWGVGR